MRFKFTSPFGWDFLQSSVGCLVSSQFNGGESGFSGCCLDGVNGSVGWVFQNMIFRGSVDTWITARVGPTKRGMVRRGGGGGGSVRGLVGWIIVAAGATTWSEAFITMTTTMFPTTRRMPPHHIAGQRTFEREYLFGIDGRMFHCTYTTATTTHDRTLRPSLIPSLGGGVMDSLTEYGCVCFFRSVFCYVVNDSRGHFPTTVFGSIRGCTHGVFTSVAFGAC